MLRVASCGRICWLGAVAAVLFGCVTLLVDSCLIVLVIMFLYYFCVVLSCLLVVVCFRLLFTLGYGVAMEFVWNVLCVWG